jgi:hypothetical protein
MPKAKIIYTPEGGSKREWLLDTDKPAWDLRRNTEDATDWPWDVFLQKLSQGSAKALDALIWTYRKRDEPRLDLASVRVELDQVEMEDIEESAKPERDEESGEA